MFLEAMEAGLPVVCYDRGGQVDFVSDAVGRVLPLGEQKRFRDAVAILAAQPELRATLGTAARALAARYSIARYAERYRAIYSECLASPRRAARDRSNG